MFDFSFFVVHENELELTMPIQHKKEIRDIVQVLFFEVEPNHQ